MSHMTHSLSELVNALNDGIGFYDEASRKTSNHFIPIFLLACAMPRAPLLPTLM